MPNPNPFNLLVLAFHPGAKDAPYSYFRWIADQLPRPSTPYHLCPPLDHSYPKAGQLPKLCLGCGQRFGWVHDGQLLQFCSKCAPVTSFHHPAYVHMHLALGYDTSHLDQAILEVAADLQTFPIGDQP